MRVNTDCSFLKPDTIKKIEQEYNGKYVLESCLKKKDGGWYNFPVAIFYTEQAHPEGSNYFAIYRDADGHFGVLLFQPSVGDSDSPTQQSFCDCYVFHVVCLSRFSDTFIMP